MIWFGGLPGATHFESKKIAVGQSSASAAKHNSVRRVMLQEGVLLERLPKKLRLVLREEVAEAVVQGVRNEAEVG
jgi:hypothetical protein